YIPAHVVRRMIRERQQWFDLINDEENRLQTQILKKNKRTRNERYLGLGWYQICKDLHLHVGDIVHFRFLGN
ncbi:DNA-binding barrel domain superfamily, partial [Sesbania bispinosa]